MPHDHLRRAAGAWLVEREELDQLAREHSDNLEKSRALAAERSAVESKGPT